MVTDYTTSKEKCKPSADEGSARCVLIPFYSLFYPILESEDRNEQIQNGEDYKDDDGNGNKGIPA